MRMIKLYLLIAMFIAGAVGLLAAQELPADLRVVVPESSFDAGLRPRAVTMSWGGGKQTPAQVAARAGTCREKGAEAVFVLIGITKASPPEKIANWLDKALDDGEFCRQVTHVVFDYGLTKKQQVGSPVKWIREISGKLREKKINMALCPGEDSGIDVAAVANDVDEFWPACFFTTKGKPPEWVGDRVAEFVRKGGKPVTACLQCRKEATAADFSKAMSAAVSSGAKGISFSIARNSPDEVWDWLRELLMRRSGPHIEWSSEFPRAERTWSDDLAERAFVQLAKDLNFEPAGGPVRISLKKGGEGEMKLSVSEGGITFTCGTWTDGPECAGLLARGLVTLFADCAEGWPEDWWGGDSGQFCRAAAWGLLTELGRAEQAERVFAAVSDDPAAVMLQDILHKDGWKMFATALKMMREDGLDLGKIGENPSALRTNYVCAYLTAAAGQDMTKTLKAAGVGKKPSGWDKAHPDAKFKEYQADKVAIASICKVRDLLSRLAPAVAQTTSPDGTNMLEDIVNKAWGQLRSGDYKAADRTISEFYVPK
jgi:hypothetical protein